MKIIGDQNLIKKLNKSIVLETIRQKSPISRANISEVTGLNKATVSALVNELIEDDLVHEIGLGQSSGGRRPVMLLFNKAAGYAIGVDLGVNYILTVLTDLEGNIVKENLTALHTAEFQEVIHLLQKDIRNMIDSAPPSKNGIVGIGIGVPGIIHNNGFILLAPNLGWENIDLHSIMTKAFGLPVIIDNEANAGAMGEKLFGTGKGVSDLIYVSVGIGIGTGIIMNGGLYRGVSGYSGEMGHFIIETNGRKCRCGNKGCWEMYASENALLEQAKSLPLSKPIGSGNLDIEYLVQLAEDGNPTVINLFNSIGEYLGIGITNIINTFNPALVIIGNRMSIAQKWIANPIQRVVESRALPFHRNKVKIVFSGLSIYSCALGAASFAITRFFSDMRVEVN